ncbi:hypothetical protein OG763_40980 [Streptomyces sp. NBC_01230]|uniref:hypothetical protein n=1 Tax=unclassified Streptomyces TaxID=2593676 RepID=UPI002E0F049A|nr:hypothetical protein OG763_40980 [Streptomyces sp. NBC_01230]
MAAIGTARLRRSPVRQGADDHDRRVGEQSAALVFGSGGPSAAERDRIADICSVAGLLG